MPEPITPRVLVEVRGNFTEIFTDPGVHICFVDYNNDPHAQVPEEFRALPLAFILPGPVISNSVK